MSVRGYGSHVYMATESSHLTYVRSMRCLNTTDSIILLYADLVLQCIAHVSITSFKGLQRRPFSASFHILNFATSRNNKVDTGSFHHQTIANVLDTLTSHLYDLAAVAANTIVLCLGDIISLTLPVPIILHLDILAKRALTHGPQCPVHDSARPIPRNATLEHLRPSSSTLAS